MMRFILATIAFVMLATPSWAGDFNKGVEAYNNGDYATALKEWTPIAEQGDARAQYNLGIIYFKGLGVTQDYKEAAIWFNLAAEQGDAAAQYNLGTLYRIGSGVTQDYKEAAKWFTLAAKQGDAEAQYNLAIMYLRGFGVTKDTINAHMWFNIANSNGYRELASKAIELTGKKMTPAQIEQAQALARECVKKEYKDC